MAHDTSVALLQQQIRDIHQSTGWQEFRKWRPQWSSVRERRQQDDLGVLLERFGIDATSQSPLLEIELQQHVAIQTSNAAKIDMLSLDPRETAKANVEDMRIYGAGRWLQEDEGKEFSKEVFETADIYGLWYGFKTWDRPTEPLIEREEGEDDETYVKRSDKARNDHYQSRDAGENFGRERINPMEMSHWPLVEPSILLQISEIPYVQAREMKQHRLADKPFRILKEDKRIHFGATQPTDTEIAIEEWGGQKVKRVRRAMLDKEQNTWRVSEYLCAGELTDATKTELLDDYEVPFGMSPYFVYEGGSSLVSELVNPHKRYRPKMYPITVKVQELNMLETAFKQAMFWRLQNPYVITFHGVDPQALQNWVEASRSIGLGVAEGAGAEQSYYVRYPETPQDGIPVLPRIDSIPEQDLSALLADIQLVREDIAEMRANRRLVGQAPTTSETATQTLNQQQSAATTYGGDLTNMSRLIEKWIEAEFNAYCYWDKDADKTTQKSYQIRIRGDEPTGGTEKARATGEEVTLTAEKIKAQRYVIIVNIASETDAERALANQQAAEKHFTWGASNKQQFLKEIGYDDPKKQEELLEEYRSEQQDQPYWDQIRQQNRKQLFAMLTGINPAMLPPTTAELSIQAAMPPPATQGPPAQTNGANPPANPGVHSGSAPLTEGASGSSSPLSGVM